MLYRLSILFLLVRSEVENTWNWSKSSALILSNRRWRPTLSGLSKKNSSQKPSESVVPPSLSYDSFSAYISDSLGSPGTHVKYIIVQLDNFGHECPGSRLMCKWRCFHCCLRRFESKKVFASDRQALCKCSFLLDVRYPRLRILCHSLMIAFKWPDWTLVARAF